MVMRMTITIQFSTVMRMTITIYCRTQNVSGHFNLANYSESILSLTFSNANKNVLML